MENFAHMGDFIKTQFLDNFRLTNDENTPKILKRMINSFEIEFKYRRENHVIEKRSVTS